jgi:hypothetical protein
MKILIYRVSIEVIYQAVVTISLIAVWCGIPVAAFAEVKDRLSMEASVLQHQDGSYNLHVVLTNNTTVPIESDKAQLPWSAYSWSKWIKASKNDSTRATLRPGAPLVEYDGKVTVRPGESLEGEIPLQAMFRTLSTEKDRNGVRIEWRCPDDLIPVGCLGKNRKYLISKTGVHELPSKKVNPSQTPSAAPSHLPTTP